MSIDVLLFYHFKIMPLEKQGKSLKYPETNMRL
jgi:hypothetical protein